MRQRRIIPGVDPKLLIKDAARLVPDASRRQSGRSEEHTSELQSLIQLVCRLLLEIGRASCRERV